MDLKRQNAKVMLEVIKHKIYINKLAINILIEKNKRIFFSLYNFVHILNEYIIAYRKLDRL